MIELIKQSIIVNGKASSKNINCYIAMFTLCPIDIVLAVALILHPNEHLANAVIYVTGCIAALGGGVYAFGKFADRNQRKTEES